jgi:hypothetical protein
MMHRDYEYNFPKFRIIIPLAIGSWGLVIFFGWLIYKLLATI